MAGLKYNTVIKYHIKAVCEGPLHIGSSVGGKEEVLIDPVERIPFIQATSIAGVMRKTYADNHSKDEVDTLFGASRMKQNENSSELKSRVVFTDGRFDKKSVKMEIRPHVKVNRETGSVTSENSSGQKFNMEYVGAGAAFDTNIYVYEDSDMKLSEEFEGVLGKLKDGQINIGAKRSSGAGRICLKYAGKKVFNLENIEDRKLWFNEEELPQKEYEEITSKLETVDNSNIAYKITMSGKTEGAILIKGIATSSYGKDAPDSENIKNANEEYIIPGSSYRGAIRAQMEKIAGYLGKESVIEKSFGLVGIKQDESAAGNLIFNDTVISGNEKYEEILRHRIHIDKFTGGVFQGALFSEKNTFGNVEFEIDILDKNNSDATLGLLMLALRDLSIKTINLGGGYATGKGFIDVDEIKISAADKSAVIKLENGNSQIEDPSEIIKNAMTKLKEVS